MESFGVIPYPLEEVFGDGQLPFFGPVGENARFRYGDTAALISRDRMLGIRALIKFATRNGFDIVSSPPESWSRSRWVALDDEERETLPHVSDDEDGF